MTEPSQLFQQQVGCGRTAPLNIIYIISFDSSCRMGSFREPIIFMWTLVFYLPPWQPFYNRIYILLSGRSFIACILSSLSSTTILLTRPDSFFIRFSKTNHPVVPFSSPPVPGYLICFFLFPRSLRPGVVIAKGSSYRNHLINYALRVFRLLLCISC